MTAHIKALRYAAAFIGPLSSAGAQFMLSLILLRVLGQAEFGTFSFLLVAAILSWGLWSALFCAPLPILFHQHEGDQREAMMRCLFSTNLLVAIASIPVFWLLATSLGLQHAAAALYAANGVIALLRWFARAYAYAGGRQYRTMTSDLIYAGTLLAGVAIMALRGSTSLNFAYGMLAAAAVLGMLPFGRGYLRRQFLQFSPRSIPHYAPIWQKYSGWSLVGVVTTEATANSHAYIVTALFGPRAFAPLAASALLIRPVSVALNALMEFERAQMARALGAGQVGEAVGAARYFRLAMLLAWVLTAAAAALLMLVAPHLIFPARYSLPFLEAGAVLWMAVMLVRLMRSPESALMQAGGQFGPLAMASVISSGVSVAAVLALLIWVGTLWSIAGIMLGECIYAFWIWRKCRIWLHSIAAAGDGAAPHGRRRVLMIAPHFQEYAWRLACAMGEHADVTLALDTRRLEADYQGRDRDASPHVELRQRGVVSVRDLFRILADIRTTRPQLIHIQEPSGMRKAIVCSVVVALSRRRCTIALTVHDPQPHEGRDSTIASRLIPFRRYIRNAAHHVFVHGEYCRAQFLAIDGNPGRPVHVTHHGAIMQRGARPDPHPGARPGGALMFGRMEVYKGVGLLLDALELLAARGVHAHVRVAGSGPELDRLQDRFARLENVVVDNRFVPSAQLINAIIDSDYVILPYLDATQSGVVAAALGNARFVIASAVGGIPDVVQDGVNGLLVPPGDAAALADALARVDADPALRRTLGEGAARTAAEVLAWPRIAGAMFADYG
ncbi:glycosyltransferase [Novosphingobium sp.]|uniref:glycosyltransferase n=1 Tax=Novosphingobium sp. TaxID=1874826 RepID=UPI003D0E1242